MYKVSQFEEKDSEKVLEFMEAHSFVTLIGFDGTYPVATQVPILINKTANGIRLIGHIMIKTDHFSAFNKHENVMVLFTGPHAYISASVYEQPASASTWNYSAIQAKGKLKLMNSEGTRNAITQLTDRFEDPNSSPAAFHSMDDSYIEKHLKTIAGFEILLEEINTVFKLSQNHNENNRKAIVKNLEKTNETGALAIAKMMKDQL
jgi:transcriptional regulator